MTENCPYITSSDEGTNYCRLSAVNAEELEELRQIVKVHRNPLINYGGPAITGTGTPVFAVAERFFAGDSITEVAKDYGLTAEQVETAVRYYGNQKRTKKKRS